MQRSIFHRFFWGLVLVAAGVVFLLNQTGTASIDIGWIFSHFWPVFLILFGLQGLLVQRAGGFLWNAVIILVGVAFLGRNLGWFAWDLGDLFRFLGPVILIVFGIGMIFRNGKTGQDKRRDHGPAYGWNPVTPPPAPVQPVAPQGPPPAPPLSDDPNASFTAADKNAASPPQQSAPQAKTPENPGMPLQPPYVPVYSEKLERRRQRLERREQRWKQRHGQFGGHGWRNDDPHAAQHHRFIGDVHIGHDYWELKPMSISHFIGDTTIDLTNAHIPLGETKIYVSCFIGDVKVFVPNDPETGIQVVSSSLIGDVRVLDHKRGGFFNQMSVETPSYSDTEKRVVLVASAFIGDVRITKVG